MVEENTKFEKLEEEIEVKADEYALEESTACNYGESSKHVYQGYFYGFKKGAEFGYNKANEWHYVKDGDLPPEDTKVLALMAGGEVCIAHFYRKNVWDKIGTVIVWKEIVLPELKESE